MDGRPIRECPVFFVRGLNQGMYVRDYKTSDYTVHGAKPGSEFLTDPIAGSCRSLV